MSNQPQPVPTTNARLKIPSSRRSRMFREIVRRLMADATLARVVETWQTMDGTPANNDPITAGNSPAVRLMIGGAGSGNRDNLSQRGLLEIDVEIVTPGLVQDDVVDLWEAVVNVVFPADQAAEAAVRNALFELGGDRTSVKITSPATARDAEAGVMRATGAFAVNFRIQG